MWLSQQPCQPTASNTIDCNACICWPIACALQPWCLCTEPLLNIQLSWQLRLKELHACKPASMLSSWRSSLTRSHWIQFESSMHRKGALQPPMMMMLGKELLSGLWVRPECRSYCCYFSHRSCLTSCSPFIRFSPLSLRPGVVGVCFEVPGWMLCLNGCSLWSRRSWLGSLVSALSFVASITSYLAPLCDSVFSLFCFLFGGHSHNDTQDVIMHVIPIAGSDPTSLCFCFVLVWLLCVFGLLGFFVSGCGFLVSCWDSSLDCVQVHYQYFCGYRQVDSLAW